MIYVLSLNEKRVYSLDELKNKLEPIEIKLGIKKLKELGYKIVRRSYV